VFDPSPSDGEQLEHEGWLHTQGEGEGEIENEVETGTEGGGTIGVECVSFEGLGVPERGRGKGCPGEFSEVNNLISSLTAVLNTLI